MTREEAIDWLARVKSNTVNHTLEMPLWWNEPLAEALDMAIKALEQEPTLSIDDVMSVFDDFMCGEVDEDGTETFLEMLKDKAESEG